MWGTESLGKHPEVDDWIVVETDGRITVRTGKVDIGQRISTALALIAAEELDVDFARVDVAPVDTAGSPDEEYTSASQSVQGSGKTIRLAAATARRHLLGLAARALAADVDALEVDDGVVHARATNRSASYAELMGGKPFRIPVDVRAPTRDPAAYRLVGQVDARGAAARRVTPVDLADLVAGAAPFVHDMTLPGMLHARLVRPPNSVARLAGLDESLHAHLADVHLVRDGSFLAVAADDEYAAIRASARVAAAARWSPERGLDARDVFERLVSEPRVSRPLQGGDAVEAPVPALEPPPEAATITLHARIERPYLMHGSIGPSAALAVHEEGTLTVWTHSQGVHPLRLTIAECLGMDPETVRLVHARGAGCYGHNGADDAALDAALVARAIPGRPVLLKWSREDEHAWEPYGPAMVIEVRASLDGEGHVIDWSHEIFSDTHRTRPRPGPGRAGPARMLSTRFLADPVAPFVAEPALAAPLAGIHRNADPIYTFPRRRVVKHLVRDMPLRTSTLRSLGAWTNVLAIESMMDELARAAGADPLAFRLSHLDDERARAVLEAAARRAGWGEARARGNGAGRGLAFARYNNLKAWLAAIVDLTVDDAASVRLQRVVVAADAGQVIDADGLALQLEGGVLQSASWALYEQVTFDEGGVTSRDWDGYPILRFDDAPHIETVLVNRPGEPCLGPSESALGPTAAAIANAIRDATGLRLERLPFTPDAIRAAALR